MKIYIEKDGQRTGPFTREELRDQTYRGEVSRNTPAWVEGEADWIPLELVLNRPEQPPAPIPTISMASGLGQLHDPKEKTAFVWLCIAAAVMWLLIIVVTVFTFGIPLLIFGVVWLAAAVGEMMFAAYLKTNAVRVSQTQLPEVYRAAAISCERLGMEVPEVFVLQHNVWNAFATKIFGRRMVVLFSGAVDSILLRGDMQQLTWLVGHELGHHWAGHLNLSHKLVRAGNWLLWVALWHSRRAELTCDRVGMFCAGSLKSSQLALVNATVGAQLASRVNIKEAAAQWQAHRREFFVRYRTIYSTHPHLLARLDHLNQAAAEMGIGN